MHLAGVAAFLYWGLIGGKMIRGTSFRATGRHFFLAIRIRSYLGDLQSMVKPICWCLHTFMAVISYIKIRGRSY